MRESTYFLSQERFFCSSCLNRWRKRYIPFLPEFRASIWGAPTKRVARPDAFAPRISPMSSRWANSRAGRSSRRSIHTRRPKYILAWFASIPLSFVLSFGKLLFHRAFQILGFFLWEGTLTWCLSCEGTLPQCLFLEGTLSQCLF